MYDSSTITRLRAANELTINAQQEYAYSAIEIGYEKYEYDEVNGRDEFNTKSTFITGLSEIDNVKTLISPYRSDSYGVEFLARERDQTKDNGSDNDLFIFDITPYVNNDGIIEIGNYALNRASYPVTGTGMFAPDTLFNGKFSPRNLLIRSLSLLGAGFGKLAFSASEASVVATINGISENETAVVVNPIFRPELWTLQTIGSANNFPLYGLIEFNYKGKMYQGYISKIIETFAPRTVEFELLGKSITD